MKTVMRLMALPLAAAVMALEVPPATEAVGPAPRMDQAPLLHLTVKGLRSDRGHLRICFWSDGEGFPNCRKNDGVTRVAAKAAETVTIDVTDLPAGEYGISIIHDENDNRVLDKGFLGMPSEGIGFSNNASAAFGPPKYAKVRFALEGKTAQVIRMKYYL